MSLLLNEIAGAAKVAAKHRNLSLEDFLLSEVHTDKGQYTWRRHRALRPIALTFDAVVRGRIPNVVMAVLKAAQLGLTVLLGSSAHWAAATKGVNVGYFFPDDTFADEIHKTKLLPIEKRSELLKAARTGGEIGVTMYGANQVWVRGLHSEKKAISITLDANIADECDFIARPVLETVVERLNASDLRLQAFFCRPATPGTGIDEKFLAGSQGRWHVTCPACLSPQPPLEHSFPACVGQCPPETRCATCADREQGWHIQCVDCQAPYDVQEGDWVHAAPELLESDAKRGARPSWSVPALIVPQVRLDGLMDQWREAQGKPSKLRNFYSSNLAIPVAGDLQPLNHESLGRCTEDYVPSLSRNGRPRWMGVDAGDSCWAWVEEETESGRPRLVWVEEIDAHHVRHRVPELAGALGVVAGVMDSKPLRDLARDVCFALGDNWAVQDFAGDSPEPELIRETSWEQEFNRVKVGRDASLAEFCDQFAFDSRARYILPKLADSESAHFRAAYKHLRNLTRKLVEGADGKSRYAYDKQVENHLGLAGNSARLARLLWKHGRLGPTGAPSVSTRAPRELQVGSAAIMAGLGRTARFGQGLGRHR